MCDVVVDVADVCCELCVMIVVGVCRDGLHIVDVCDCVLSVLMCMLLVLLMMLMLLL